ncbi:hypothetical protein JEZ13_01120 [bacterium]|nr:hypothetical protein [bacterium]
MTKEKLFDPEELININQKKGLPRAYRFSLSTRITILVFAFLVCCYAVYYLITKVATSPDATMIAKFIPIIIFFAGLNTILQNLFNIHKLILTEDALIVKSLIGIKREIPFAGITKISMSKSKKRYVIIQYIDTKNKKRQYFLMLVFRNMIEILNSIGELAINSKYDDFMTSIIVSADSKKTKKTEVSNEK